MFPFPKEYLLAGVKGIAMNAWNLSQRLQLQTHACLAQKFKKQIKQEFKKNNQKIIQKNKN